MTEKKQPLFVMDQPATFTWPVKVRVPLNGKYGEAEFVATLPNMGAEQLDKLLETKGEDGKPLTDREIARRVLLGFEPLVMPDGSNLTFSEENRELLLDMPRAATAVVGTLIAVCRGVASEKN